MSTASSYLTVAGINVDVVYKDIKNLHIGVYPPVGRVRVAAPTRLNDDTVRLAVIQRLPWIKSRRTQLQDAERQSQREMVSGETHHVWGIGHRLIVVEGAGKRQIEVRSDRRLTLSVPAGTDADADAACSRLVSRSAPRAHPDAHRAVGAQNRKVGRALADQAHEDQVGLLQPRRCRLWFNVELAKKHPLCLEYIVVHEMAHLLERTHSERFTKLMDGLLPDWRTRRDELNGAPLAHEEWDAATAS
jgi:predicted metal-dependent hydrolase